MPPQTAQPGQGEFQMTARIMALRTLEVQFKTQVASQEVLLLGKLLFEAELVAPISPRLPLTIVSGALWTPILNSFGFLQSHSGISRACLRVI